MKVLHFISAPAAGGAEVYVKDLSKALVGAGHQVHIVFLSRAQEIGRDEDFEDRFLTEISSFGITWSFMPEQSRRNFFKSALFFRKIVKENAPDIIHCHLYYALFFSFFTSRVPVIYTHHNIRLKIPGFLFKILDFKVRYYVGISLACSRKLASVSKKPVHRIDNGIDTKRILLRSSNGDSATKIVMVGSLCEQKNYSLFLKSVSLLRDLDFSVSIAGEGPYKIRLQKEIARLGIQDRVSLIGNISDIPDLLAKSDLFAMSSLWEGLPISLLEATAAGLPSIVTNVGGCSEVVHACQSGAIVDELTPSEYAKSLAFLIQSKELRDIYAHNAIKLFQRYKIETSLNKHLHFYSKAIYK